MNICHLASGDLWAGAEVQVYNMLSALTSQNDCSLSAIILNKGTLADKLREAGVKVTVKDESQHGFLTLVNQVKQYCRANDIDILHTHRYKENIIGGLAKKAGAVKHLVQTIHGLPEPFSGIKGLKAGVFNYFNRYYMRNYFDRIQAVSSQIKTVMSEVVPEDSIWVVYNSINPENVRLYRMKPEILTELQIPEDTPVVGTVGRLVPIKGFDILIRAHKILMETIPEARLILVGDGPLREDLESEARALGIEKSVIFTGYRKDVLDIINSFSLFALSSYNEGVPTVVLEAMSLGIPVVSTAVGGVPEVITDEDSGLLVPPGTPERLAEKCIKLLQDKELSERLCDRGQAVIDEKFTNKAQGQYVKNIYMDIFSPV